MALARGDQAALVGGHHDLGAVAEVELGEDPADVGLDRLLRQHQRVGDLAVGQAAGDQLGDLQLARGQAGELIGTWPVAAWLAQVPPPDPESAALRKGAAR